MEQQTPNQVKDIIKGWMNDKAANIHTALPGIVVSYDHDKNRASVQPAGLFKTNDGRSIAYPVIHHVPVVFPMGCGGSAGVTFPLEGGDGCLLVFSEGQLDDFLINSDSDDQRRHSLNDAICIPGLYSDSSASGAASSGNVVIRNKESVLTLSPSGFAGTVGGTSFSVGGGDLIVNGISLVHHTHPGDSGGITGQPK